MSDTNHDLPAIEERPLVTFALFAYNQEKYIREAVEGAFAQTYEPLEIILSDDCSTDRTFEIMQEMAERYSGPHKIKLKKNNRNLKVAMHLNSVLSSSNGELVVFAAGDDVSLSTRTARIVQCWHETKALLMHSDIESIDRSGNYIGLEKPPLLGSDFGPLKMALSEKIYIGATGAIHKSLYLKYGDIKYSKAYEDLVYGYRAILEQSVMHISEPLVRYRKNSGIIHLSSSGVQGKKWRSIFLGVVHDVYKQRLDDIITSGRNDQGLLIEFLAYHISSINAKIKLIESPKKFLHTFFKRPIAITLKALLSEWRYISISRKLS